MRILVDMEAGQATEAISPTEDRTAVHRMVPRPLSKTRTEWTITHTVFKCPANIRYDLSFE
jgi:hypothetical protein